MITNKKREVLVLKYNKQELIDLLKSNYDKINKQGYLALFYSLNDQKFYDYNINTNKDENITFNDSPVYSFFLDSKHIKFNNKRDYFIKDIIDYIDNNFVSNYYKHIFDFSIAIRMELAMERLNEPCTNISIDNWINYILEKIRCSVKYSMKELDIKNKKESFNNMIKLLNKQGVGININNILIAKDRKTVLLESNSPLKSTSAYNIYKYNNTNKYLAIKKENISEFMKQNDITHTDRNLLLFSYPFLFSFFMFDIFSFIYLLIQNYNINISFFSFIVIKIFCISKIQYNSMITIHTYLINKYEKSHHYFYLKLEKWVTNFFYFSRHIGIMKNYKFDEDLKLEILLDNNMSFNKNNYKLM